MVGTTVVNRFEIGEPLGSGGFGTVYRAWDRRLEREVAVKVVETGPDTGARTRREAQAAARLNHPGIVTLYEFVHHELGSTGGRAFLVSELVEGSTVRELIDREALSDREVARIGTEVAASLDHAHSRGVVHRDLKPSNLISPEGEGGAKLMDFGVARLTDLDDLTRTGDVLGTLSYMAPEQAEGLEAGPEADVYALGLVLYEAWAGFNPRKGATAGETARAIGMDLPPLSDYRPDLPVVLTDLVDACLANEPEFRPEPAEIAGELDRVGRTLDPDAPFADRRSRVSGGVIPGLGSDPAIGRIAAAFVFAAAAIACLLAGGSADLPTLAMFAIGIAIVSIWRPRFGFLTGGVAVAAWLGLQDDLAGAALAVVLLTVPVAVLTRGEGSWLVVVPLGPALGLAGLAPVAPFLAALAPSTRDRVVIAAGSLFATGFAEVAFGRKLLFGESVPAGPADSASWSDSVVGFLSDVVVPTLSSETFLVSMAVWISIAALTGLAVDRWRRRKRGLTAGAVSPAAVGSGGAPDA